MGKRHRPKQHDSRAGWAIPRLLLVCSLWAGNAYGQSSPHQTPAPSQAGGWTETANPAKSSPAKTKSASTSKATEALQPLPVMGAASLNPSQTGGQMSSVQPNTSTAWTPISTTSSGPAPENGWVPLNGTSKQAAVPKIPEVTPAKPRFPGTSAGRPPLGLQSVGYQVTPEVPEPRVPPPTLTPPRPPQEPPALPGIVGPVVSRQVPATAPTESQPPLPNTQSPMRVPPPPGVQPAPVEQQGSGVPPNPALRPSPGVPPDTGVQPAPRVEPGPLSPPLQPGGPVLPTPPKGSSRLPEPMEVPEPKLDDKQLRLKLDALIGRARNDVQQRRLKAAVELFEQYLRLKPDDNVVRKEYAGILAQLGQSAQAAVQYQQLLVLQPENKELRTALADILLAGRSYQKSLRVLEEGMLNPETAGDPDIAIRLALVYTILGEIAKANEVVDRFIIVLSPETEVEKIPVLTGGVLVNLDRPGEALRILQAQIDYFARRSIKERQGEIDLYIAQIRAYAALGLQQKALEVIRLLEGYDRQDIERRLGLANALYLSEKYELAEDVFSQILRIDPSQPQALLGSARVQIQTYRLAGVTKLLRGLPGNDQRVMRLRTITEAELKLQVGEYIQAKDLLRPLLAAYPSDSEARLLLGSVYLSMREYEKAKAEYAKAKIKPEFVRVALLGIARVLALQREFEKSDAILEELLASHPGDAAAAEQMIRNALDRKFFASAENIAAGYLERNPRLHQGSITMRLALGRVKRFTSMLGEAVSEYSYVLDRNQGALPIPRAHYGLSVTYDLLGEPELAFKILTPARIASYRNKLLIADFYAEDARYAPVELVAAINQPAIELLSTLASDHPDAIPALVRLGEAHLRIARQTAEIGMVVGIAQQILHLSPNNVRALQMLGDAYAVAQRYQDAVAQYEKLIKLDPNYLDAKRNRARLLYAANRFDKAGLAYQEAMMPTSREQLQHQLDELAQKDPGVVRVLEYPRLPSSPPGALSESLNQFASSSGNPSVKAALNSIELDYQARQAEETLIHAEWDAKSLKGLRNFQAIGPLQGVIGLEPANNDARFDLAEVYGLTGNTHQAAALHKEILAIDPQARDSYLSLDKIDYLLGPQLHFDYSFFKQDGFGRLAESENTLYTTRVRIPFDEEDDFVDIGFTRQNIIVRDDAPLSGNIGFVRYRTRFSGGHALFDGTLAYEDHPDRFTPRPVFNLQMSYQFDSSLTLRSGGFLENVIENGETLRQDIYRGGFQLGADYLATRRLFLGGAYTLAYYSDSNYANIANAFSYYSVFLPPRQLRLVANLDYFSFGEQTQIVNPDPTIVLGAVHPYFAPASFFFYQAGLEWRHWLSRDFYKYANQAWYQLGYRTGWDSQFNNYHTFQLLTNLDVRSWLSVGASAFFIASPIYDVHSAMAFIKFRRRPLR